MPLEPLKVDPKDLEQYIAAKAAIVEPMQLVADFNAKYAIGPMDSVDSDGTVHRGGGPRPFPGPHPGPSPHA